MDKPIICGKCKAVIKRSFTKKVFNKQLNTFMTACICTECGNHFSTIQGGMFKTDPLMIFLKWLDDNSKEFKRSYDLDRALATIKNIASNNIGVSFEYNSNPLAVLKYCHLLMEEGKRKTSLEELIGYIDERLTKEAVEALEKTVKQKEEQQKLEQETKITEDVL